MYFYRTRSGLELDLLIQTEQSLVGIEIKGRQTVVLSDIRPMKEIAAILGKNWLGGLVVYQGNEITKLSEPGIWAVPSRRLFL